MGSATAPVAVRRALAPNTLRDCRTDSFARLTEASDEGVAGSTRGACAPQTILA